MLDRIRIVKQRFDEVSDLIIQPDIISDQKRYVKLNKEYKDLQEITDKYLAYKETLENLKSSQEMLQDEDQEMREMAKEEIEGLTSSREELEAIINTLKLNFEIKSSFSYLKHNIFLLSIHQ